MEYAQKEGNSNAHYRVENCADGIDEAVLRGKIVAGISKLESNSESSSVSTKKEHYSNVKVKVPMNFGDCGHPPNSIQQFGFAGGH